MQALGRAPENLGTFLPDRKQLSSSYLRGLHLNRGYISDMQWRELSGLECSISVSDYVYRVHSSWSQSLKWNEILGLSSYLASLLCLSTRSFPHLRTSVPRPLSAPPSISEWSLGSCRHPDWARAIRVDLSLSYSSLPILGGLVTNFALSLSPV